MFVISVMHPCVMLFIHDVLRGLVRSNIQGSYNPNYHKSFMYAEGQGGSGVDAYIIDTGIYCDHQDFASKPEGSCVHGVDYVDGSHVDINGHGTHVAGVVAGAMYGVAKEANVISVRVLDG
jgi:subtilisin family serine protease